MSNKKPEVELLPSPDAILRAPIQRAELDKLVQQKVAEILTARDEFVFEPFFRSRQVAYELKRLQTVPEQRKWHVFYERHGCVRCKTTERIHTGNGFCANCYPWVHRILKQIIRELMGGNDASRTVRPSQHVERPAESRDAVERAPRILPAPPVGDQRRVRGRRHQRGEGKAS